MAADQHSEKPARVKVARGKTRKKKGMAVISFVPYLHLKTMLYEAINRSLKPGRSGLPESLAHQLGQVFNRHAALLKHGFMKTADIEFLAFFTLNRLAQAIKSCSPDKIC